LNPETFYDYIDSDPVVPVKISASKISKKYLAFLDTGSYGIAETFNLRLLSNL
jgi:hypothetical protein